MASLCIVSPFVDVVSHTRLHEALEEASAGIGYRRFPVVSPDGPSDGALFIPQSDSTPSCAVAWPVPADSLLRSGSLTMRHALSSSESQLAVVSTVQFNHAGEPVKIEARVGVAGHLRAYSERRRDAIWRGCAFIEALKDEKLVDKAEILGDEGTHWFDIPDASGSWRIDIPLEGSRRRATRRFFEWASQSIEPRVFQPQDGHGSLFFTVPTSQGLVRARLHHNLLNGSLLPDEDLERYQQRYDHAFEWSLVRKCWKHRRGLADVEAEFGRPTVKLGPHDPSGTGLSSLEPIRDQWVFADLSERHLVLFREYDDGRLAVNLLDIESIS